MDAYEFLRALAIVLGTAGVTTVLCHALRQPVVLGYLVAGLIVGPHVPIPLVADRGIVMTLSELGVILLMFALGLEFRLRKILEVGPTAGLTAVIETSILFWLGTLLGRAFGWTSMECLFAGALLAISSTTIIAKAFEEQRVGGRLRELVVGVLIVEDLLAILVMAILTAVAAGQDPTIGTLAWSSARLATFLVVLMVVGLLIVPRAVRYVNRLGRSETTLVVAIALCFSISLLARELGYSVALGAFLAGTLVAESGEGASIERLIHPVRDMFAAIFFVSVGMLIEPSVVVEHAGTIGALTLFVIVGKVLGVTLGAFLTGHGVRTSVQAGMSLAQIGEFSFILASQGISLGATGSFLYPIAVAVSALTTFTTPWLIRASGPCANYLESKLPHSVQTYAALYGSWLEELRARRSREQQSAVRRLSKWFVLDVLMLGAVLIGAAVWVDETTAYLSGRLGLSHTWALCAFVGATAALAAPFAIGVYKLSKRLGLLLAESALPIAPGGRLDLAAAPRRALVVSLQLAFVLLAGLPLAAITQPFLPGWGAALVLVLVSIALGVSFWRSAANLQGHVRAGAQMLVEVLSKQTREHSSVAGEALLLQARELLPGLGEPVALQLSPRSAALGHTLAELNLRGQTGATILAITRGLEVVVLPDGHQSLHAGDRLALTGTQEAIAAARALLERE